MRQLGQGTHTAIMMGLMVLRLNQARTDHHCLAETCRISLKCNKAYYSQENGSGRFIFNLQRKSAGENNYQINCSWHNQMTGGICNQEVTLGSLTVSVRFRRFPLYPISPSASGCWQLDRQARTRVTQDYTRSESRRNIRSPVNTSLTLIIWWQTSHLMIVTSENRTRSFPWTRGAHYEWWGCWELLKVHPCFCHIMTNPPWVTLTTLTPHITPDTLFVSWLDVSWLPARRWICVPVPLSCEHSRGLVWTQCVLGLAVSVSGQLGPSAENLCDQLVSLTMEHLIVWVLEERFLPQNYILISHYWQYEVHPGNHLNNKIASHCTRHQHQSTDHLYTWGWGLNSDPRIENGEKEDCEVTTSMQVDRRRIDARRGVMMAEESHCLNKSRDWAHIVITDVCCLAPADPLALGVKGVAAIWT